MEHHKLIPFLRYSLALLLFLAISAQARGGYKANNLYSTVYIGPSHVNVGQPFSITCTVSISESIQWMKDGEMLEKYSKLMGHHVSQENSYVLTESDVEDGENILLATLSVSQAQPWHEGKYQCNRVHPNSHYLRVVVNSGSNRADLHRHRQREHHGRATTTTMVAEIDVVASQLTSSRPATTVDLDIGDDGTTSEIGNDDVDSQIDAGTSTTGREMVALEDDFEGTVLVGWESDGDGDGGVDDDLVVDIEDDGGKGGKIEKENAQVNELADDKSGESAAGVSDDVSEATGHLHYTVDVVADIEELSTTSGVSAHGSESDAGRHGVDANGVEIDGGAAGGARETFTESTAQKDKQLEKLVVSKGDVLVPNYDHTEAKLKVFEIRHPLVLFCNVTEAGNHELQWSRNGTSVENVAELKGRYTILKSEYKLVIDRTQESDAGLYTCSLPHLAQSKDINVVANVYVKLPSNMAVIEGEKLQIQCIVVGTNPEINWTILDNITSPEANSKISYLPDERNIKNAILVIESAQLTDRGNYSCEANNLATVHRITKPAVAVTFLRVKGKLAALWPFLGICAEVFILCAIILVYEKRRNKADPDESDTDQSPEQKKKRMISKNYD
ncbi:uncharacterized protein LOC132262916 isoform X2 [Phlebotomus argentipes]|uniref:uncharacterized protein LOC132262916 isoform X2 n=1 Tax=Phlebotomus argentipes TaxID=94469 RepID=UPI002893367D|nr:uncharacterized protein LOC132262916 isoform X2 [Phlebotomus argentipes]